MTRRNPRRESWIPPRRPEWVARVNEEGRHMDLRAVVPLDADSLLRAARAKTGLHDFGSDDWEEPFGVLLRSLEEEAELSLIGRLMTRTDLLHFLESRLLVEATFRRHPQIAEQDITEPVLIIGQGRSGTSALHNLLAEDPHNRTVKGWEAIFPCLPPERASDAPDSRIATADALLSAYGRVTPEVRAVHEFAGSVPTENIHLHAPSFQSTGWLAILGQVPSYNAYMAARSMLPALRYERRLLQLLQWRSPRQHWITKSPDAIRYMPEVLQVYPDLQFLWIHRDPVKAMDSALNMVGVMAWIRSDKPQMEGAFDQLVNVQHCAGMLTKPIEWLKSGVVPERQLCNVQYADFVADPLATVERIYARLGRTMTAEASTMMGRYIESHFDASRPPHVYASNADASEERRAFADYERYFRVTREA